MHLEEEVKVLDPAEKDIPGQVVPGPDREQV